jgi:type II secretory pathway component PulK
MTGAATIGRRGRQRGVALITVLLVFALATVVAAEMLRRSQLGVRSFGNLLASRSRARCWPRMSSTGSAASITCRSRGR